MLLESTWADSLRSSLDRLAEAGYRHLKRCGVPREQQTRTAALGLYDRQLHLHDRLVIADAFIQRPQSDGFAAAAVEDATRFLAHAEQAELELIEIEKLARAQRSKRIYGAAAVVLALVALLWLMDRPGAPASEEIKPASLSALPNGESASLSPDESERNRASRSAPRSTDQITRTRSAGKPASIMPDRASAGEAHSGPSNAGRAAKAQPSKASASSSGAPSDRAAPDEGPSDERKGAEQASRSSSDDRSAESQPMTDRQQQAGSISGSDSAQESDANPEQIAGANAANRQASARSDSGQSDSGNRPAQRGASGSPGTQQPSQQPNQNDAQSASASPGASNSQSQGKGQGSSKDALKKSRGVASMILGVPVPDRVKGLPNPGLVRTMQTKTTPKEEQMAAVNAEARAPRTSPLGHIEHPEMRAWMKDLVRAYFSQDAKHEGKP